MRRNPFSFANNTFTAPLCFCSVVMVRLTCRSKSEIGRDEQVIRVVQGVLGKLRDHRGIHNPLFTVRFDLSEVSTCHDRDSIWVDVHEEWLSEARQDS
jgi:hypothetical protein